MTAVASVGPVSLLARRPEGTLKFLFWSAVVHAALFSLAMVYAKLREDAAIGSNDRYAGAAGSCVGNPTVEHGNLVGSLRGKGSYRKWMNADEANEGLELAVGVIFIAGAEGALGEKVHGQQGARKERQEGESEFPKKFTPHVSRTDSLRRGRFSGAGDFPDRIQSFRGGGGRKRPRCGA